MPGASDSEVLKVIRAIPGRNQTEEKKRNQRNQRNQQFSNLAANFQSDAYPVNQLKILR
jgi:hypothetical protein